MSELLLFGLVCDHEIVGYFENAGDRVGADTGSVFVRLTIDNTIQSHVAVLDGNADRLRRVNGVAVQRGESIDRAIDGTANTVVHGRHRINGDIVDDVLDALHVGGDGNGGIGIDWSRPYRPE